MVRQHLAQKNAEFEGNPLSAYQYGLYDWKGYTGPLFMKFTELTKKIRDNVFILRELTDEDFARLDKKITLLEEKIEETADIISGYAEVTHNYLRLGHPNIWFTLIARDAAEIERILAEISERAGVGPIRNLPARKMLKIKVDLKLEK